MGKIRIQKFLSECGVASRRKAEEMILEGRVRLNDRVVTELGAKMTPGVDKIKVGSRSVNPPTRGMILVNKPKGVVTTMSDPGGRPTIAHFLDKRDRGYVPVGRLDYDSTGLVVLTNDGELAHRLMHPKFSFERIYHVRVAGILDEKTLRRIDRGVRLEDGVVSANVTVLKVSEDWTWLEVKIGVGKNRIIRRLFEHLRHPVTKLHRISHGPVKLGKIRVGDSKRLTDAQFAKIRERIFEMAEPDTKSASKKRARRSKH
ncbi:MAG: rRNA pseudouridine synthase [Bdellovibrionales bacterium]|nr:rRNA pseudouridine synthase [Bdellovibrionales bacterium]